MTPQLMTIAVSPAIAMVWFFYARSAYRPHGRTLITVLFLLGFLSGVLALVLNHLVERYTALWAGAPEATHRTLFWLLGIGLNEEFAKMVMLLIVLYPRRDFSTPYQGLLGGATVALGFAAMENLFYLERYGTMTLVFRSFLTVPAHAFFTAPLGVALAFSKRAESLPGKYAWLAGGLIFAMVSHGIYDIWLSLESPWLNHIAYLHVVLMGVFVLWLMRLRVPPLPATGEHGGA
jgi:RsiW-degrading membrane proteinase PrsW (M82 family)